jgi:crotonobetainyl-CoA:carnitine CoA-transferase CaiB-like acyl-CoA transferase
MRALGKTAAAAGLAAGIGALASQDTKSRWYTTLSKRAFQPPAIAFPIVWTGLYADVAVSSASVIDHRHDDGRHIDAAAFERALYLNNGAERFVDMGLLQGTSPGRCHGDSRCARPQLHRPGAPGVSGFARCVGGPGSVRSMVRFCDSVVRLDLAPQSVSVCAGFPREERP